MSAVGSGLEFGLGLGLLGFAIFAIVSRAKKDTAYKNTWMTVGILSIIISSIMILHGGFNFYSVLQAGTPSRVNNPLYNTRPAAPPPVPSNYRQVIEPNGTINVARR